MTFALAVPTGTRREPTKVPCGAGKQQSNRTNGMWCPVLAAIYWSRYGAPGEQ
jgi:hypothetical protein